MKKSEYMNKHGLTLRKVTAEDREAAKTDYQRTADYIISNGKEEFFSRNGSLKDMKDIVKWNC